MMLSALTPLGYKIQIYLTPEVWRSPPIERGDAAYEVSNLGRVRCVKKLRWSQRNIGLVPTPTSSVGYPCINLFGTIYCVHSLVAHAFIPKPRGKRLEVNHKDGNRKNNVVTNLEWVTRKQNMLHKTRVLKHGIGSQSGASKLTEDDVLKIRELAEFGVSGRQIAEYYSVSAGQICLILKRKSWKHVETTPTKRFDFTVGSCVQNVTVMLA